MSFPYDWLAPGEIRYCSCGYNLIDFKNGQKICPTCSFEEKINKHETLWNEAVKLAQSRKDSGVQPLFWLK